jgi:hypothetical protein
MLAKRTALAIPAFVDRFTRHLRRFAAPRLICRKSISFNRFGPIDARSEISAKLLAAGFRLRHGHDGKRWGDRNEYENKHHHQTEH